MSEMTILGWVHQLTSAMLVALVWITHTSVIPMMVAVAHAHAAHVIAITHAAHATHTIPLVVKVSMIVSMIPSVPSRASSSPLMRVIADLNLVLGLHVGQLTSNELLELVHLLSNSLLGSSVNDCLHGFSQVEGDLIYVLGCHSILLLGFLHI
jgi:hypothetical protein